MPGSCENSSVIMPDRAPLAMHEHSHEDSGQTLCGLALLLIASLSDGPHCQVSEAS
jgi:hypothetical protein